MASHSSPISESTAAELVGTLIESLVEKRWAEIPFFLSNTLADALRRDAETLVKSGVFRGARIGRGSDLKSEKSIRSDEISWFEPGDLSDAQNALWRVLEHLKMELNRSLFLGLHEFEAHYARYPSGSSYGKHLDRFATDDARTVSVVLYLNENWKEEDGGQLMLYPEDSEPVVISPTACKLVCFLSDAIEHEVLPSPTRTRLSVAAWFRKQKSPLR